MLEQGAGLVQQADGEPGQWRGSNKNMGYSWSVGAGRELVKKRIGAGGQGALRREKELKKVSWLQQGHSIRKQSTKVLFPALLPPFHIFLNLSPEN